MDFKFESYVMGISKSKILEPVVDILDDVADTSELFMRSLQMYNLFADKRTRFTGMSRKPKIDDNRTESIEKITGADNFNEMKIGAIVRTELRKLLEDGMVSNEEIQLMQTRSILKKLLIFSIPCLCQVKGQMKRTQQDTIHTNYSARKEIFFMLTDGLRFRPNNDRPYLLVAFYILNVKEVWKMLKDALVAHKSFGAGKVTDISDQYITICFEDAIKIYIQIHLNPS